MTAFLIRWFITTISVYIATRLVHGIYADSSGALLGASLLLGIINAFIRPILLMLSLPFIVLTMGVFIFVINALLLRFVSWVIPPFHVSSFGDAFWGAIIISLVSWLLSLFFRASDGRIYPITHHPTIKNAKARTIDS